VGFFNLRAGASYVANPTIIDKTASGFLSQLNGVTKSFTTAHGGCIYVAVASNVNAPSSVLDNHGSVYSQVGTAQVGGSVLTIYAADNVGGGSGYTFTARFPAATSFVIAVVSIFNVPNPSLDAIGASANGVSSAPSSSVTTAVGQDLVLMAVRVDGAPTITASGGDTLVVSANAGSAIALGILSVNATAPGAYTTNATLSVSDPWLAFTWGVLIGAGSPLQAQASGSPSSGVAPLAVAFTGAGIGGTPPYSYGWTFGDGGVSAAQNPSHTYASKGSFTAQLTVTDSVPNTATANVPITVAQGGAKSTPGTAVPKRIRPATPTGQSSRRMRVS